MTPKTVNSPDSVLHLLRERFRCPEEVVADIAVSRELSNSSGFFRLGPEIVCYGQCSSGDPVRSVTAPGHDASEHVGMCGSSLHLPFDPVQVIDNLRNERYQANSAAVVRSVSGQSAVRNLYYRVRPLMPVSMRKHLQRFYLRGWEKIPFPKWPVDRTVDNILEQLLVLSMRTGNIRRVPFVWFWPEGARSCTMLTHDVESSAGVDFCPQVMDLDDAFGIKSSFQVVPEERYPVPESYLENIRERGFEVNVQDLNHDGLLYADRTEFLRRAKRINEYGQQWGALGFRSAILYRNTDWYDALDFSYDMSIPNVGHLDPQRGGCCTVLPFFVGKTLELPVTTTQDYSLFHILNDYSIGLWKEQSSLIREKHGLVSFIMHPDYIIAERPRRVYAQLLQYLSALRSQGETWIALPRDVAAWWRQRSELDIVNVGGSWRIEGKGSERAKLAYAVLVDDKLSYEFDPAI
jgi:hypothetical protein